MSDPERFRGIILQHSCFPGGSAIKDPPANAGDTGSIPGLQRLPGEGNGNHSSILAGEISQTEEPSILQSMRSQKVGHDLATKTTATAL